MKLYGLFLITMLLCVCGCGNEQITSLLLKPVPVEAAIGPVPEDLANLLWGDLDAFMAELEIVEHEGFREYLINGIALIREHRAFYGKYINAGGVAILGNASLEDICFYAARDAVLIMTSKMPQLREHLSPIRGERENLTGKLRVPDSEFRMVIHDPAHSEDIPEWKLGQKGSPLGSCGLEFCHATTAIREDHTGKLVLSMNVFVHEFAHAINYAFNLVDVTFEERLKVAYQDAKANDDSYFGRYHGGANVTESGSGEYWAWSSMEWFTQFLLPTNQAKWDHTRFQELDPLMYELLNEIYDFHYIDSPLVNR